MVRTFIARALVLAAAAACVDAAAQSTLYRWVDKDGKVTFSDTPPPADAKSATQKRFGQGAVELDVPFATRDAMKRNPVMLWVTPGCEPCNRGRELLSNRGIPFGERDAQANIETQEAFKKVTGGDLNVPLLEVGASKVRGFEEAQWNAALDAAGYPKDRPFGQPPSRPAIANLPPAKAPAASAEPAPKPQ